MSPIAATDVSSLALDRLAPAEEDPPTGTTNGILQANVILYEVLMPGAKKKLSELERPAAPMPGRRLDEGQNRGKEEKASGATKAIKWLRPMLVDSWYPSNPTCQHIERVLGLRAAHDWQYAAEKTLYYKYEYNSIHYIQLLFSLYIWYQIW